MELGPDGARADIGREGGAMRAPRQQALIVPILVAAIAVPMGIATAQPVQAAVPNYAPPACPRTSGISRVAIQPTNNGTLQVARIGGAKAGAAEKWDLKADLWFCNRSATSYFYVTTKIEFLDSNSAVTKTINTRPFTYSDSSGRVFYKLPSNTVGTPLQAFVRPGEPAVGSSIPTVFSYPLPAKIRFTTKFKTSSGASTSVSNVATVPVANQVSPGTLHGFFFPESQVSLPPGAYYFQTYHDDLNLHNRYALDIGAQRFDLTAGAWTQYRKYNAANPSDPANNHHLAQSWLIWGAQVRAMSDGEIVSCVRGDVDNEPYIVDGHVDPIVQGQQQYAHPGGNYLWVRTGNQTQVYAHLQYLSIPFSLCPYTDNKEHKLADPYSDAPGDAPYQIHEGQLLGFVGNSGNTSNPHTHVESIMGTSEIYGGSNSEFGYGSDSRPMNFINVKVQPINWSSPAFDANWNELSSSRVIPANSLIMASDCGYIAYPWVGKREVVHAGTRSECWAQEYNVMLQAGFRPVHYDSHPKGTSRTITTVWRPDDGTPWVLLHGLTASGLQNAHNTYIGSGWRYLNLQSYQVNGNERYGVIFVKQPGATQWAQADMSLATFSSVFGARSAAGYRMVDYSVVVVSGVRRYTGLWVYAPAITSYVVEDVAAANYQSEFNTQTAAGRMPVSLDGYELTGTAYLSTIWYGSMNSWGAAHGLSKTQVGTNETSNLANGLFARAVTEYGLSTFAAVWRAAPNTSILTKPASSTTSTMATFTFKATNDQLATFECSLDHGSWTACASPKNYSGLATTGHVFAVRARDFQGLRDLSPAGYSWTVTN
jgi:hypothetical protein